MLASPSILTKDVYFLGGVPYMIYSFANSDFFYFTFGVVSVTFSVNIEKFGIQLKIILDKQKFEFLFVDVIFYQIQIVEFDYFRNRQYKDCNEHQMINLLDHATDVILFHGDFHRQ